MPSPRNMKKVKQFLGLTGYCCKCLLRFVDISLPLSSLTKKETPLEWTKICHDTKNLFKKDLTKSTIVK